jgi:CRP-like cAMP-binding protein
MRTEDSNLLLMSLSPSCRMSLLSRLKRVTLPVGSVLYSVGETPRFAHFLTSGIASIVSSMTNGASSEVGLWGHEGLVQSFQLLGRAKIPNRCFVQMDATALVMPSEDIQREFQTNDELREKILQCVQSQGSVLGQLAACNRLHEAEQRLARWLLMVCDRVEARTYRLTQEFLSIMLGTRRTTVTAAASSLKRKGVISYSRGNVRILDADGLKHVACECYDTVRRLYWNFYDGQQ